MDIQVHWEYKVVQFGDLVDLSLIQKELNRIGLDGWELVAMTDTTTLGGGPRSIMATFKRAVR